METAVLLRVPEAEPLVREWRAKGDPSAAHGVPAHVTLLYPFVPSVAANAVSAGLPFRTTAESAALWVQGENGAWAERAIFPFGPPE